tara:strand:+ start:1368 stop:1994 length:627 start_codon:yes stop_codon:yes gene_type:complete
MAISQLIFERFSKYLKDCNSVLELGNQTFVRECIDKYPEKLIGFSHTTPVKKYVENKNIKHTSIDITGLDGSIPIDLNSSEIPLKEKFDLVTNFGTSEHIEPNQYEAFLHIHNLCKIGGLMIHEVPHVGFWEGHCKFYYDEAFFKKLAEDNNYSIVEIKRINYPRVGDLVFAALKKNSKEFKSEKQDLERNIHKSEIKINIPEYWKNE